MSLDVKKYLYTACDDYFILANTVYHEYDDGVLEGELVCPIRDIATQCWRNTTIRSR